MEVGKVSNLGWAGEGGFFAIAHRHPGVDPERPGYRAVWHEHQAWGERPRSSDIVGIEFKDPPGGLKHKDPEMTQGLTCKPGATFFPY